jgi:hypothetical protein
MKKQDGSGEKMAIQQHLLYYYSVPAVYSTVLRPRVEYELVAHTAKSISPAQLLVRHAAVALASSKVAALAGRPLALAASYNCRQAT